MALTDQQQTSILQLIQAMFNATPGAIYLQALGDQMAAGKSLVDMAQSLSEIILQTLIRISLLRSLLMIW